MVPLDQVLYGTDYPFRPGAEVNAGIAAYGFSAAEIEFDRARRRAQTAAATQDLSRGERHHSREER